MIRYLLHRLYVPPGKETRFQSETARRNDYQNPI